MNLFSNKHATLQSAGLIAVLSFAIVVGYHPGLSGGFLFDDFANLKSLGKYGGIQDWEHLWLYLTSGIADPTGRPLALLTFLIDARDWPADPFAFKRTNLAIHILNALLLLAVLRILSIRQGMQKRALLAAFLAAAFWALHPLWVSTTLYVVQRHAMLPVTFVLLALLAWEMAWRRLEGHSPSRAWLWGTLGVGAAAICAVLSKANGALTPILVALVWLFIYRPRTTALPLAMQPTARRLAFIALIIPSLLVLLFVLSKLPAAFETASTHREWSLGERLLSQPRALIDYLRVLWIPRFATQAVYADSFVVSRGLLTPWTTLPSLILLGVAFLFIAMGRKRFANLTLALSFFFAGHLIESTWIPLEPYFEHRSYLPALVMFWPLALWLTSPKPDGLPKVRLALMIFLPLLLCALLFIRANTWGNPAALAASMAREAPQSARAQGELASRLASQGELESALRILDSAADQHPDDLNIVLPRLRLGCRLSTASPEHLRQAAEALQSSRSWTFMHYRWFKNVIDSNRSDCDNTNPEALRRLLSAAEQNPRIRQTAGWLQDIGSLRGHIEIQDGNILGAKKVLSEALRLEPNPDYALTNAATLASAGAPELAWSLLQEYRDCCWRMDRNVSGMLKIHQRLKWRPGGYYEHEFNHLQNLLKEEMRLRNLPDCEEAR